jgi:hypothetical protein
VRDYQTGLQVARAHGKLLRDATHYGLCEVEPERLEDLDLNTWIGVSHVEGIAASGSGYSEQTARIVQADYYPDIGNARLRIRFVVAPDTDFKATTYGQSSLWALAPTEQVVQIAEMSGTTGHDSSALAWALQVAGSEYMGGRSRT